MASKDIEDEKLLVDDDSVLKHERTSPDTSLNVTEQTTLLELSQTMNDVNEDDFQQVEMKPISDKNTMKSDDVENGKPEAPLIHVVSRDSTDKEDAPLIDEESKEHKTNGIPYNKDNEQNIKEIETNNLDQEDGKKDKKAIENGTNNEHSSKKSAKKRPSEKLKLVKTHSDHSQSSLQSPGDGGTPRGKPKALNVAVFLKEGTGRLLMLEKGRLTTAGEIKKMMLDNLALPLGAKNVFALWLVSPLLEIQLKDNHVPFKLRKQWPDMVDKFTTATEQEIAKDEPVMVFQRNSFLSVADEKKITDERIIRRLFEEAKVNILSGRYPVTNADAEMLGGYLARIEFGKFDLNVHKVGFFKKNLSHYLPPSACRNKLQQLLTRSESPEQKLLTQYERASERADDPKKYHGFYLEFCWALPFYGSAFFKGRVEQLSRDYLWKSGDMKVNVAIGREGITIFKEGSKEILMSLSFDDVSWDLVTSTDDEVLDSFCLEFDTTSEDGRHLAQQLQVFSPQAVMMDAMVESCVAEMNRLKIPKSPTSPVFMEEGKPLPDTSGPPLLKRDRKSNFSLSSPFKRGK